MGCPGGTALEHWFSFAGCRVTTERHHMRVRVNEKPLLDIAWTETGNGICDIRREWHQPPLEIMHRDFLTTVRDYLQNHGWPLPDPPDDLEMVRRFVKPVERKRL